ncbi:MAG: ATP-binding protein [Polyangiales bacterium]
MEGASRLERRFVTAATLAVAVTSLVVLGVASLLDHREGDLDAAREQHRRVTLNAHLRARDAAWRASREAAVFTLARALDARPREAPMARALLDALALLAPEARPRVTEVLSTRGTVLASSSRPAPSVQCGTLVLPTPLGDESARVVATFDLPCAPARVADAPARPRKGPSLPLALIIVPALAAALATAITARGTSRRIRALALAAERVGDGDLTVRVRPRGDDELGELMRTFNHMVDETRLTRERVEYLQRVAAWQEFARRLAHEIKNPLTPIQLAVQEVARKYSGDDERFQRTLDTAREVVEEEVATLRRLVTAFSDFARLPDVKPAPGDLAEFVRDMANAHALLDEAGGERPGVILHFDPGERAIPVALDRIMLKRAYENLVRNAVQALGAREGNVWVRAEVRRVELTVGEGAAELVDQAWLVVEDDGPGVPRERQSEVFVPYFTTKSEGTGLGLAIVRKIALDHNGDVGCDDRPGGGARFTLTLPLRDPSRKPRWSFVTFSR